MRKKILIIEPDEQERERLEDALIDIVDAGGELFFAKKQDEGLEVLKQEKPALLFIDESCVGDRPSSWTKYGSHLVVVVNKKRALPDVPETLFRPITTKAVLEKCRNVWGTFEEPNPDLPPM